VARYIMQSFKGMFPKMSSRLIGDEAATLASNVRIENGEVYGWHQPTQLASLGKSNQTTIFNFGNHFAQNWLSWPATVDIARSPNQGNVDHRVFYTDGSPYPKTINNSLVASGTYKRLGIAAPATALSAAPVSQLATTGSFTGKMTASGLAAVFGPGGTANAYNGQVVPSVNVFGANGMPYGAACVTYTGYNDASAQITAKNITFSGFQVGTVLTVASVVDANTITVNSGTGAQIIAAGNFSDTSRQQGYASNKLVPTGTTVWSPQNLPSSVSSFDIGVYDNSVSPAVPGFNVALAIPNGVTLTIPNHNLRVGDTMTVTKVDTVPYTAVPGYRLTTAVGGVATGTVPVKVLDFGSNLNATFNHVSGTGAKWVTVGSDWTYSSQSLFSAQTVVGDVATVQITASFAYSVTHNQAATLDRVYTYTWVTDLGEESAPAPPSVGLVQLDGDTVLLANIGYPPTDHQSVTAINIYRTLTGSNETTFQLVAQIPAGTTVPTGGAEGDWFYNFTSQVFFKRHNGTWTFQAAYPDSIIDASLGEVCPSTNWDPPPAYISGLITSPNGWLAGFVGNTVAFSEPGYPHAWPTDYYESTDYNVVGLAHTGQTTFVLTDGMPYAGYGVDPRNISLRRIEAHEACLSKRSIAIWGGSAFYASSNGLMRINETGLTNVTKDLLSREQWQSINPSSILGCIFNGRYFGFYDITSADTGLQPPFTGASRGGFVIDPLKPEDGITTYSGYYYGYYVEPGNGDLYLCDGSNVLEWANSYVGAVPITMTWRSKLFGSAYATNLGAARILATSYPVTFRLYVNNSSTAFFTKTVTSDEIFRLPSGHLYTQFQFEVQTYTTTAVQLIHAAETATELTET
jgi:hypothetical protein